jgi:hypothetical protein
MKKWLLGLLLMLVAGWPAEAQLPVAQQCIASAQAGGTPDAITIPALPCALTTNLLILNTLAANATTTPTLQPLGLAALTIVRADGMPMVPGDIAGANYRALLTTSGTNWILLNPASVGAQNIAYTGFAGATATTVKRKLQAMIDPVECGAANDGVTDDSEALNACITQANLSGRTLLLTGSYAVSAQVPLFAGSGGILNVLAAATIIGTNPSGASSVIQFGGNARVTGEIKVRCQGNPNYLAGAWMRPVGGAAVQSTTIDPIDFDTCLMGWRVGDVAYPGAIVSESSIRGGLSYNTPVAAQFEGYNTYIAAVAPQWVATATGWFADTGTASYTIAASGAKTITIGTGHTNIVVGMVIEVRSQAAGSVQQYQRGVVTGYNSGTGLLSFTATSGVGVGVALTNWIVRPEMAGLISYGANVTVNGGELVSAAERGRLISNRPVANGGSSIYGTIALSNVTLEEPSILFDTINPSGATINTWPVGKLTINGGGGYVSQDDGPFINTSADFYGNISASGTNFFAAGVRTTLSVSAGSTNTQVEVPYQLGPYFLSGPAGISGGTLINPILGQLQQDLLVGLGASNVIGLNRAVVVNAHSGGTSGLFLTSSDTNFGGYVASDAATFMEVISGGNFPLLLGTNNAANCSLAVSGRLSCPSIALTTPLPVSSGGTGSATASGTTLDNITGFSSTGFINRTGAGAYSFFGSNVASGVPLINGSITSGDCLKWSASGIQDAGAGCGTITALTGDVTASGNGSVAATLATVNANTGSWGTATQGAQITVNGKGLVTAAANVTITPAATSITAGALPGAVTVNNSNWSGTPLAASNVATGTSGANIPLLNGNNTASGTWIYTGTGPQVTLGANGGNIGVLNVNGSTSGSALITVQATAGTPTLTLGTSSGTPAVTASSPLAITTATGNITCATCVTSSGGGAITGVSPIAVSAAGAVSISGAAGQVPNGVTGAFTATPTLGASGTLGSVTLGNATSGTATVQPVAGALGTVTASLPANTGTIAETNLNNGFTAAQTITSAGANALAVGASGVTNPALNVDASTASSATGLNVKSAAAGGGLALSVKSSGTNENATLDAKGSGTLTLNGTATGAVATNNDLLVGASASNSVGLARAVSVHGGAGTSGLIVQNNSGVQGYIAGNGYFGVTSGGAIPVYIGVNNGVNWQVTTGGHLTDFGTTHYVQAGLYFLTTAAVPTLSACGTGSAVDAGSSASGGKVTFGTAATACTVTFATAYPNNAYCTVALTAAPALLTSVPYVSSMAKTGFTISDGTASAGYLYTCSGN